MYKKKAYPNTMHCCDAMKYAVENSYCAVEYAARYREYIFRDYKSNSCIIAHHCFHCGIKLPESLRSLWFKILRTEYDIEEPSHDLRKVPKDFRSDIWWKKRGYKELKDSKCETGVDRALF